MTNLTNSPATHHFELAQDDIRSYVSAHKLYEDALLEDTDVFASYEAFKAFLRRHSRELQMKSLFIPRQGSVGSLVHRDIVYSIPAILRSECIRQKLSSSCTDPSQPISRSFNQSSEGRG